MNGKIFDAALRVLLCGLAVILLTALAIPELIELGVEKEWAEETVAPWLSFLIVLFLYTILFAWPHRVRKVTPAEAEKKKARRNIFWQSALTPLLIALILIPVLHLAEAPPWLRAALTAAVTVMAAVAAIEWQILKRKSGKGGRR